MLPNKVIHSKSTIARTFVRRQGTKRFVRVLSYVNKMWKTIQDFYGFGTMFVNSPDPVVLA